MVGGWRCYKNRENVGSKRHPHKTVRQWTNRLEGGRIGERTIIGLFVSVALERGTARRPIGSPGYPPSKHAASDPKRLTPSSFAPSLGPKS